MKDLIKRDRTPVIFDGSKIRAAILKAASTVTDYNSNLSDGIVTVIENTMYAYEEFSDEFFDAIKTELSNLASWAEKNYVVAIYKAKATWGKLAFKVKPNFSKFKSFLKRLYSRLKPKLEFLIFLKGLYDVIEQIKDFVNDNKPSSRKPTTKTSSGKTGTFLLLISTHHYKV